MTALNPRQRVKANAALALIAMYGHNPRPVQASANAHIARGLPANIAYERALEEFAAKVPAMRTSLEVALELVANSDDATVALYGKAIDSYSQTGSDKALEALAPMIVEDAKALAIKSGEVSAADAVGWDLRDALAVADDAFSPEPFIPDQAPAEEAPAQNSQFAFLANAPAPPPAPAPAPAYDPSQPVETATGYRPGMTGEKARQYRGTPVGDIAYIQTATGFRVAPTGEAARREAGVPLTPDA